MAGEERGQRGEAGLRGLPHWVLVGTAILLAFAAALAKEIGITIVGALLTIPFPDGREGREG